MDALVGTAPCPRWDDGFMNLRDREGVGLMLRRAVMVITHLIWYEVFSRASMRFLSRVGRAKSVRTHARTHTHTHTARCAGHYTREVRHSWCFSSPCTLTTLERARNGPPWMAAHDPVGKGSRCRPATLGESSLAPFTAPAFDAPGVLGRLGMLGRVAADLERMNVSLCATRDPKALMHACARDPLRACIRTRPDSTHACARHPKALVQVARR